MGECMDETQIIELYFLRDEQAIEETKRNYGRICIKLAYNILNNFEDSEECVNDTYLAVWEAIPPAYPQDFTAFICKITRNLALKRLAYNNASKRSHISTVSFSEIEAIIADNKAICEITSRELGYILNKFLENEKKDARSVFLRRYWFFDSVSDIAKMYGFSENKVKSMLFRTRNKLRIFLRKEGIDL